MALFVWFIPESPRWLIAQDRPKAAKAILTKYHGEGDPENIFVTLQMAEMTHQITSESNTRKWWDYRHLFNTKSARARIICVSGMAWFGQYSGNTVVG